MMPADYLGKLIHEKYILPACAHGDMMIEINVLELAKDLGSEYSANVIGGVLGSMRFRNTYHLLLAATKGPPDRAPIMYAFKLNGVTTIDGPEHPSSGGSPSG